MSSKVKNLHKNSNSLIQQLLSCLILCVFCLAPLTNGLGTITANLILDDYTVNAEAKYTFQISTETPLTINSTIVVWFDPKINVILPFAPKCEGLNGFNGNPQCKLFDQDSIEINLHTIKLGQSVYQFAINGIENPNSALKLTNQIHMTSWYNSVRQDDQSQNITVKYQPNIVLPKQGRLSATNSTVGMYSPFNAVMTVDNQPPADGKVLLKFPKWDDAAQGATIVTPIVSSETVTSCSVIFSNAVCTVQDFETYDIVTVVGAFTKNQPMKGQNLQVVVNQVRNPPSMAPLNGFEIITTDAQGNYIDVCKDLSLTMDEPAIAPVLNSYVHLNGAVGLNELGTYDFYFETQLPIPMKGSMIITIPDQVSYQYISQLKFVPLVNAEKNVKITQGDTPKHLVLKNVVSNYLYPGRGILFQIQGLKNPSSTVKTSSFEIATFDSYGFAIETLSQNLTVNAVSGNLDRVYFYPLDINGVRLYATEHQVEFFMFSQLNDDGYFVITMENDSDDFYIDVSQDCVVEGLDFGIPADQIQCNQNKSTREITIKNFIKSGTIIKPSTQISFKLKNTNIRNPISTVKPGFVEIRTRTIKLTLDTGKSTDWFAEAAPLSSVKIQPNTVQTQLPNIEYLFTVRAPGPILQGSEVTVIFPEQIFFNDPNITNQRCGQYFKSGLPTQLGKKVPMACNVTDNTVVITGMFEFSHTTDSPQFQFTVPGLTNPRLVDVETDSFQVFIANDGAPLYNITEGAGIFMNVASEFPGLFIKPASTVNQANTTYEFQFETYLPILDGDYFQIQFPIEISTPQTPICQGDNFTLQVDMNCQKVTKDTINVYPAKVEDTDDPLHFTFTISGLINPKTTAPTESFHVTQFSKNGNESAHEAGGLYLQMSKGKPLQTYRLQMTPDNFDSNAQTNYVVEFQPTTVYDGMYLKITFPEQVTLTNETSCDHVVCVRNGQVLKVHNWEKFTVTNLINPPTKAITSPFKLQSYTTENYLIESLDGFMMNFKCALPCNTCLGDSNRICETCDTTGKYLLYQGMCYSQCPKGLFLMTDNKTCSDCPETCAECVDYQTCTSCKPGALFINNTCPRELPFYYFMPVLILAIAFMIYTTIVECKKKTSRWIPHSLSGLCYFSKILAGLQVYLYFSYNMIKVLHYVVIAGFVVPLLIAIMFSILYCVKFKKDLNVTAHRNSHLGLHILGFIGVYIGDYRAWKYLYTAVNPRTQMLAFKVQFKYYNRGLSFACLLTDCFLAFAGGAALTTGLANNLQVVTLMSIERLILSSLLIGLTVTEWSFKSKISKEEKMRIHQVHSIVPDSVNNADKTNIQDESQLEDVTGKVFDPNFESGSDFGKGKIILKKHPNKDLADVVEEGRKKGKGGKSRSPSPSKGGKGGSKSPKGKPSSPKKAEVKTPKGKKGSLKKSGSSKSPDKMTIESKGSKSKKSSLAPQQLESGNEPGNNSATNDEQFEATFRAGDMARGSDDDFNTMPNRGSHVDIINSDHINTFDDVNVQRTPGGLQRIPAMGGTGELKQIGHGLHGPNDRIARSTFQNEGMQESDEWRIGSRNGTDDESNTQHFVSESPQRRSKNHSIGAQFKRGNASDNKNKFANSPGRFKKQFIEDTEDDNTESRFQLHDMTHGNTSTCHFTVNHFSLPQKSKRESKVKPNKSYLDNQEVFVANTSNHKSMKNSTAKKNPRSPTRDRE